MLTEEQRRALHALREALRLCEGAEVGLHLEGNDYTALWVICHNSGPEPVSKLFETDQVLAEHVVALLQEYPES